MTIVLEVCACGATRRVYYRHERGGHARIDAGTWSHPHEPDGYHQARDRVDTHDPDGAKVAGWPVEGELFPTSHSVIETCACGSTRRVDYHTDESGHTYVMSRDWTSIRCAGLHRAHVADYRAASRPNTPEAP